MAEVLVTHPPERPAPILNLGDIIIFSNSGAAYIVAETSDALKVIVNLSSGIIMYSCERLHSLTSLHNFLVETYGMYKICSSVEVLV